MAFLLKQHLVFGLKNSHIVAFVLHFCLQLPVLLAYGCDKLLPLSVLKSGIIMRQMYLIWKTTRLLLIMNILKVLLRLKLVYFMVCLSRILVGIDSAWWLLSNFAQLRFFLHLFALFDFRTGVSHPIGLPTFVIILKILVCIGVSILLLSPALADYIRWDIGTR